MFNNKEYQKKYSEENKEKLKEYQKEYQKGYREKNKEKSKKYKEKYREKNKEKLKEYRNEYEKKNKEYISGRTKKYRKNNKKSIQKFNQEYSKRPEVMERENKRRQLKRDTNPIFRLNNSLSSGIRISLQNNNLSKNRRHWEDMVGYAIKEIKEHLEKLFQPGMSWDNYGKWHIDHIIPKSFFKYKDIDDTEFKYCWSLDNLQPLWEKDNYAKNDKVIINGKEIISRLYEGEV